MSGCGSATLLAINMSLLYRGVFVCAACVCKFALLESRSAAGCSAVALVVASHSGLEPGLSGSGSATLLAFNMFVGCVWVLLCSAS